MSEPREIRVAALLAWYDRAGRDLPWRVKKGRADPYRVWLSEVMLQQTTVATASSYFNRFITRWPTLGALAAATLDEVLAAWAGLGYYARARNLHKCARLLAGKRGGEFPTTEADLRALPGIGRYTAAAIAAIAFGRPAVVVDGNVERVMARLFCLTDPLPGAKPALYAHAAALTPRRRPGDYAQAVMDLGAILCTPRAPQCSACPWAGSCLARARGMAAELPRKSPKTARPRRQAVAFWLERDGPAGREVLLRRRPENGLLGGMLEVPSSPWIGEPCANPAAHAPVAADWRTLDRPVRHTFSHFHLELTVMTARYGDGPAQGTWYALDALDRLALPTVMKKLARSVAGNTP